MNPDPTPRPSCGPCAPCSGPAPAPDLCQADEVHAERIERARQAMRPSQTLRELAELFKVLGDHTRVRLLHALALDELCVCDLSTLLGMSQSAISHQLRVLRAAKIVKYRREGRNAFYSLDDRHIHTLMRDGLEHVEE